MRRAGLTVLEVAVALGVASTMFMALAAAFTTSLQATSRAERMTDGAMFFETVMTDVGAQPYDNLLSLNGNQVFEGTNAGDSEFVVGLTVFSPELGLIQIDAVMTDLDTGRVSGRLSTWRSQR